jgi:cysteine desulfurase
MEAYLDHAATTPMRPEAVAAMVPLLTAPCGNPSGAHSRSRAARRHLDDARDRLAEVLGFGPGDVVFTGGGTEADNLAVFGVHDRRGGTVVCSAVEHPAVLQPVQARGGRSIAVDGRGQVDLDALDAALDDSVSLVSIMAVNNEVGVVQPLDDVVEVVRRRAPRALLHSDAVQAVTWLPVERALAEVDLISVSAHKLGGPMGVGALAVRPGTSLAPQLVGGGQERGRRSGTQNVAGAVAMAAAAAATARDRPATATRVTALRDRLVDGLIARVDGCLETGVVDGRRFHRVPGSAHVCFEGVESEALLVLLEQAGVSASAASSCASGAMDPSHVLAAMGLSRERARGSLRLSLGWTTTDAEIDHALAVIPRAVAQLRDRAPVSA